MKNARHSIECGIVRWKKRYFQGGPFLPAVLPRTTRRSRGWPGRTGDIQLEKATEDALAGPGSRCHRPISTVFDHQLTHQTTPCTGSQKKNGAEGIRTLGDPKKPRSF